MPKMFRVKEGKSVSRSKQVNRCVCARAHSRLKDFHPKFLKAKRILDTIGELYDAVLIGKVKIVPI